MNRDHSNVRFISHHLATGSLSLEKERVLTSYAIDAYIYGFPLVLMEITKSTGYFRLMQRNRFYHQREFSTPSVTQVVRPNVDTLYSIAWLDLNEGPLLLHVPNTHSRYYLLPMLDAWSNVFASVGARTTGTNEQLYVIVGPFWKGTLPAHIPVIPAPTRILWIAGRTQSDGVKDYPQVHSIQNQFKLTPLFHSTSPSRQGNFLDGLRFTEEPPSKIIGSLDAASFFTLMMAGMEKNPPYPAIQTPDMTCKLRALGLIPSPCFQFHTLDSSTQHALQYAAENGPYVIEKLGNELLHKNDYNGWSILLQDMGFYGTNYQQRAVVAQKLFGANLPQDSVYAYSFVAQNGSVLNGRNSYRVHFQPGQLPLTNAFWSITLYNEDGFLVDNSLHRYAISPHLGKLNDNEDGSLDIYIGSTSPGSSLESNWLPAPEAPFNLMLRIYWPKLPVLEGNWHPPAVVQVN
ncbi:DUF1254 domain-containing protein [Brevibacillus ginsengisoli]|uniref:DUF1254 domain-containing protein n=1 Tax=Brevibacillus ginsengisoli TaxID=363854 RepID=UPI003CF01812